MNISVSDVAELVGGELRSGDPAQRIEGFASLKEAGPGDLSFYSDHRYKVRLLATRASAILLPKDCPEKPSGAACIEVADPSRAFETVVERFAIPALAFSAGVHSTAVVSKSAVFDPAEVSIGPHAVIEEGVALADGAAVGAGCYVGRNVRLGAGTKLCANCTVHEGSLLGDRVVIHSGVVIGGDGFGYEFHQGRHRKIRQSGIVQIDNDVEVGPGTMIDRARFGRTWIGEGTKIDNLVQIGHNVVIGKHAIIVACTAIAGSAVIGDYVIVAAQCGIAGHVFVGPQAKLGARSGVTKDLAGGANYLGYPAVPANEERKRLASTSRLPQLLARVKELEERLADLEKLVPAKARP